MKHLARVGQYSGYLGLRVLICVIQAMPIETCHAMAGWLAVLFTTVIRLRRKLVDDNLLHAFPDLTAAQRLTIARQMWEHLFLIAIEVAHAPRKIHDTNWRDFVSLEGQDRLARALLDKRPLMIVSGHFGNFEAGGYVLGLLGFPTTTVARTLDNPYVNDFVGRFRGITGQRIVPKNGGYDQLLAVFAGGGTTTYLADQYAGRKGCWVDFFGRPASTHKAIALLALEHKALICFGSTRRTSGPLHFELEVGEVIDPADPQAPIGNVRDITQWYTAHLEATIRRAPEQYWWLHRRWKGKPPARRKVRAA
jgi:KDO2-lipid IV(A) lauroyltransferase